MYLDELLSWSVEIDFYYSYLVYHFVIKGGSKLSGAMIRIIISTERPIVTFLYYHNGLYSPLSVFTHFEKDVTMCEIIVSHTIVMFYCQHMQRTLHKIVDILKQIFHKIYIAFETQIFLCIL